MKGADQLIIAILMIVITVTAASLVSGWATTLFHSQGQQLQNQTSTKLACQMASFYVRNVSITCNYNCFTGSPYSLNASVENTGSQSVSLSNIAMTLSNGISHALYGTPSSLSAGATGSETFNAIQIRAAPRMPVGTMDTRAAYFNDTNTTRLYHFDYSSGTNATDNASYITATLFNGSTVCQGFAAQCPAWNSSGIFGSALSFDGINDYVATNATGISNDTGTVETWVNMNRNSPSNDYGILDTPSEISSSDSGLVGLWHFSENSTAANGVKDSSPYGNNGTATNTPMFTNDGRFGTAWNFDGETDYVTIPNSASLSITTAVSVAAWIKMTNASGYPIFKEKDASHNGDYLINMSNVWICAAAGGGVGTAVTNASVILGKWTHVALTFKSNDLKCYINGVLSGAVTKTLAGPTGYNAPLLIGGGWPVGAPTTYTNSTIDEVAVYNRILTPQEIASMYAGGLALHKLGENITFVAGNVTVGYNASALSGWQHVAGSYNSTVASLYINDVLAGTVSRQKAVPMSSRLYIGGFNGSATFNGTIDEVRVSSFNRTFNVTFYINVTYPNIKYVRLFNATGLVNQSTDQSGASSYYTQYENAKSNTEFRVEVEDTSGLAISKWYPYVQGGMCMPVSSIDRVRFAADNCPGATDSYYGSDVYYEQCVV